MITDNTPPGQMQPTIEGRQLLSTWLNAMVREEQAKQRLAEATRTLKEVTTPLIQWMLPSVIKPQPGEKICIWMWDSLFQVEVGGLYDDDDERKPTQITIRYRGTKFEELRL